MYLMLKKLKRTIWYLKNLNDLFDTNVKLKGPIDVFWQKRIAILKFYIWFYDERELCSREMNFRKLILVKVSWI
jgi:hypothetical protein